MMAMDDVLAELSIKRKVGRPITSERTLARNFPPIDEIRAKLLSGQCYARTRTSGSSSVWSLFEETAFSDSHEFTGIVRCKSCNFMTRYHGQITGTSHMRRHHCFVTAFPEHLSSQMNAQLSARRENTKSMLTSSKSILMPSKVKKARPYFTQSNGEQTESSKPSVLSKGELTNKIMQFCCEQLVNLESMTSESFKALALSFMRFGAQLNAQLGQRCSLSIPDLNQLNAHLNGQHSQIKRTIKDELTLALSKNVGGVLVCDSDNDLCVISAYYIDSNWTLMEKVLSATSEATHINSFITNTLEEYGLHDDSQLAKFTFVSRGGLFDGVSMCLTSMAHVIDGVIESAVFGDHTYTQAIENCQIICNELSIQIDSYAIDWVNKFEILRNVIDNRHKFELTNSSLDLDLVQFLVQFLSPLKAASVELRECSKHPTLNHVLLWYYKLLKALSASADDDSLVANVKSMVRLGMEQNFQIQSIHKIAAFLWPNFRFLKMLTNEEREEVHNEVRHLLQTRIIEAHHNMDLIDSTHSLDASLAKKSKTEFDEWEDCGDSSLDELSKYISVQLTTCNEQNILLWWKQHQNEFPKLSRLAKWILSIPASVTSLERFKLTSSQRVNEQLLFMHCNMRKEMEERKIEGDANKILAKQK